MYEVNEKDWKLYKERLPIWQERYIAKRLKQYSSILAKEGNPSSIFFELLNTINKDKYHPGISMDINSRSHMIDNIEMLINYKVIDINDLDGFSIELLETIILINKQ